MILVTKLPWAYKSCHFQFIFGLQNVNRFEIEIQSICDECGKDLGYRQDGGRKT
jgi:hypothetical protein